MPLPSSIPSRRGTAATSHPGHATLIASILASFGIGFASGYRAAIPALLLGVLHHTSYFELAPRFAWLASPAVIGVLAVIAVVEIAADRMPESAELVALASWLPKAIIAFLGAAAVVGTVDSDVMALGASGLLGATVAVATDRARAVARKKTRDLGDSGAPSADRAAHHAESIASVAIAAAAALSPGWVIVLVLAAVALMVLVAVAARALHRAVTRRAGLRTGDEADPRRPDVA